MGSNKYQYRDLRIQLNVNIPAHKRLLEILDEYPARMRNKIIIDILLQYYQISDSSTALKLNVYRESSSEVSANMLSGGSEEINMLKIMTAINNIMDRLVVVEKSIKTQNSEVQTGSDMVYRAEKAEEIDSVKESEEPIKNKEPSDEENFNTNIPEGILNFLGGL